MPPQGLLVVAAYMPASWQVRFVDENIAPATEADLAWADVVLMSGMHIQAPQIRDIHRRAKAAGKVTVLGGPSVSASPEMYPEIDYLHCGELGDATDRLVAQLDASLEPPPEQVRFETKDRLPMPEFPIPAYDMISLRSYLLCTIQFSSGCPYRCEFCDIPGLYGRQPRFKTRAADHRRARRHVQPEGASQLGLFRRRQFHRQSQGGARSAAAFGAMAKRPRLPDGVVLRGDAQYRQAGRNP